MKLEVHINATKNYDYILLAELCNYIHDTKFSSNDKSNIRGFLFPKDNSPDTTQRIAVVYILLIYFILCYIRLYSFIFCF